MQVAKKAVLYLQMACKFVYFECVVSTVVNRRLESFSYHRATESEEKKGDKLIQNITKRFEPNYSLKQPDSCHIASSVDRLI